LAIFIRINVRGVAQFRNCDVKYLWRLFFICSIVDIRRFATMNAEREREIIRLWNRLRLLQRQGQPTGAVRRQIEKAMAEREEAA
jgi:hypothetical protein